MSRIKVKKITLVLLSCGLLGQGCGLAYADSFYSGANNFNQGGQVNERTGALQVSYPLINHAGLVGTSLSLQLNLMYNSGNSSSPSYYALLSGWSLSLPYYDTTHKLLYLANGSSYPISGSSINYYPLQNLTFSTSSGTTPGNQSYQYSLTTQDGTVSYFDQYGRLIEVDDRFGNEISYQYYDWNSNPADNTVLASINLTEAGITKTWTFTNFAWSNGLVSGFNLTDPAGNVTQVTGGGNGYTITDPAGKITQYTDTSSKYGNATNPYNLVTGITTSSGLQEAIQYTSLPFTDPNGSLDALPAVSEIDSTDLSTNTPLATQAYQYGTTWGTGAMKGANFTGYPTYDVAGDGTNEDPLIDSGDPKFTYETQKCLSLAGSTSTCTVDDFNAEDLLTTEYVEDVSTGKNLTISSYSYPSITGWNGGPVSPVDYQLPANETTQQYNADGSGGVSATTSMQYNNDGQMTSETLPNGTVTTTSYGSYGLPLMKEVQPANGNGQAQETTYTLSSDGKTITNINTGVVVNGQLNVLKTVSFGYDGYDRLATQTMGPGTAAASFVNNPDPVTTTYVYQNQGNDVDVTKTATDATSGQVLLQNQTLLNVNTGNVDQTTDGDGNYTTYQYDGDGRVTAYASGDSQEWVEFHVAYADNNGILNGPNSETTTYPDQCHYMTSEQTNAMGQVTQKLDSNAAAIANCNGAPQTTELQAYTYNGLGELISSEDVPTGISTGYSYDVLGRKVSAQDPDGVETTWSYAEGNNGSNQMSVMEQESGGGSESVPLTTTYDNMGNAVATALAGSQATLTTTNSYDGLNNLTQSITNNHLNTTQTYNALNILSESTLSNTVNSLSKNEQYDYLGDLVSVTDSQTINNNSPSSATPINNSVTGVESYYNGLGWLVKQVNPKGQSRTFSYDQNGNMTGYTNWAGDSFSVQYTMNQPTSIVDNSNSQNNITNTYDPVTGNLLSSTSANHSITKTYYPDGLVATITYDGKAKVSYTYTPSGLVDTMTDPNGAVTKYYYDPKSGVLKTANITLPNGTKATVAYQYDNLGRLAKVTDGNGVTTTYTYNAKNQVESMVIANSSGTLQSSTYQYSELGQLTNITAISPLNIINAAYTKTYSYDLANRLIQSTYTTASGTVTHSYAYDAAGNLVDNQSSDSNISLSYNNNQLTNDSLGDDFSYNQDGDLTSAGGGLVGKPDTTASYSYNDLDQLTSYNNATSYSYYPNGLTATEGDTQTTLSHYYDVNGDLISDTDNDSNTASYLIGASPVARIVTENNTSSVNYYVYDVNGNVVAEVGSNGSVEGNSFSQYSDFGQTLGTVSTQAAVTGNISINTNPLGYQAGNGVTTSSNGLQTNGANINNPATMGKGLAGNGDVMDPMSGGKVPATEPIPIGQLPENGTGGFSSSTASSYSASSSLGSETSDDDISSVGSLPSSDSENLSGSYNDLPGSTGDTLTGIPATLDSAGDIPTEMPSAFEDMLMPQIPTGVNELFYLQGFVVGTNSAAGELQPGINAATMESGELNAFGQGMQAGFRSYTANATNSEMFIGTNTPRISGGRWPGMPQAGNNSEPSPTASSTNINDSVAPDAPSLTNAGAELGDTEVADVEAPSFGSQILQALGDFFCGFGGDE